MRAAAVGMMVLGLGCGFSPSGAASDGAHAPDSPALGSDAAHGDAAHDGGGSGRATAAADLVLGAGRTTVGAMTVDIQLGAGPQATHLTAGAISIDGQPVVKP